MQDGKIIKTDTLVSIVTPSYNKGSFIEGTILSVMNQTYPHIEHIVVDGGSTDGTVDILQKYDNVITWVSEPDKGQSDAVNKGWRRAHGQIVAYLNADDTYMPRAVETVVNFLNDNPDVGMVYGECNIIDECGEIIGKYPAEEFDMGKMLCARCVVPQPAAFIRREVLDDVGYLDTGLDMAMDYDLWIRIGLKFKVAFILQVLASFRLYPSGKSLSQTHQFWPDVLAIVDKTFSNAGLPKEIKPLRRKAYSHAHLLLGRSLYAQLKNREARQHLLKAVILSPICVREPGVAALIIASCLGRTAAFTASRWKTRLRAILGLGRTGS